MKKTLNLLVATMIGMLALTSCNKDNEYDDSWYQKEIARIDSTNKAQAPILKEYALEHLGEDSKLDTLSGIWFIELGQAPENSFNYINSSGQLNSFLAKVVYTGRMVPNGEVFDSTDEPKSFSAEGIIQSWLHAFYPKSVELNGMERKIGGLTAHGLNKGSKIRIVAPSTLCYDNEAKEDIPPNTPLDFEIDVKDISQ